MLPGHFISQIVPTKFLHAFLGPLELKSLVQLASPSLSVIRLAPMLCGLSTLREPGLSRRDPVRAFL